MVDHTGAHTAGPWESDDTQRYYAGHVIRRNGIVVCKMNDLSSFPTHGDRAANARLIAAAPDLLACVHAAYIAALRRPYTAPERCSAPGQIALVEMRDALAAAEGRSAEDTQRHYEDAAIAANQHARDTRPHFT